MKTEFSKFGDDFKQVKRTGNIAMFHRGGNSYEVIKVQKHKCDMIINGKTMALAGEEYYPSTNQFGTDGWCFSSLEKAEEKFDRLVGKK